MVTYWKVLPCIVLFLGFLFHPLSGIDISSDTVLNLKFTVNKKEHALDLRRGDNITKEVAYVCYKSSIPAEDCKQLDYYARSRAKEAWKTTQVDTISTTIEDSGDDEEETDAEELDEPEFEPPDDATVALDDITYREEFNISIVVNDIPQSISLPAVILQRPAHLRQLAMEIASQLETVELNSNNPCLDVNCKVDRVVESMKAQMFEAIYNRYPCMVQIKKPLHGDPYSYEMLHSNETDPRDSMIGIKLAFFCNKKVESLFEASTRYSTCLQHHDHPPICRKVTLIYSDPDPDKKKEEDKANEKSEGEMTDEELRFKADMELGPDFFYLQRLRNGSHLVKIWLIDDLAQTLTAGENKNDLAHCRERERQPQAQAQAKTRASHTNETAEVGEDGEVKVEEEEAGGGGEKGKEKERDEGDIEYDCYRNLGEMDDISYAYPKEEEDGDDEGEDRFTYFGDGEEEADEVVDLDDDGSNDKGKNKDKDKANSKDRAGGEAVRVGVGVDDDEEEGQTAEHQIGAKIIERLESLFIQEEEEEEDGEDGDRGGGDYGDDDGRPRSLLNDTDKARRRMASQPRLVQEQIDSLFSSSEHGQRHPQHDHDDLYDDERGQGHYDPHRKRPRPDPEAIRRRYIEAIRRELTQANGEGGSPYFDLGFIGDDLTPPRLCLHSTMGDYGTKITGKNKGRAKLCASPIVSVHIKVQ